MDQKFNMEDFKANSETSEKGYSIIQAILGGIMVAIGYLNLPCEYRGCTEDEPDPCPNQAAYWLWIAGILLLVANSINGWAKIYKKCAEKDGKIDCGEKVGMAINSFASGAMTIVDFAMLIWGSVVVFGAWSQWTDDREEWLADQDNKNFCEYTPMMTAFVILLLKWIMIPAMIVITCFCACCCACCCAMCAPKQPSQN